VALAEKFVQHHLRWFGHIQRRPLEAPICSGVISWIGNGRRDRGRLNLTWEESVKKDLKDWSITKELALNRREWKLTNNLCDRTLIFGSYSFIVFYGSFFIPFRLFCVLVFLLPSPLFLFVFSIAFLSPLLFHFCFCFCFSALVGLSLAYRNLLGTKRLDCWLVMVPIFLLVLLNRMSLKW
jgi:hypothetical protein